VALRGIEESLFWRAGHRQQRLDGLGHVEGGLRQLQLPAHCRGSRPASAAAAGAAADHQQRLCRVGFRPRGWPASRSAARQCAAARSEQRCALLCINPLSECLRSNPVRFPSQEGSGLHSGPLLPTGHLGYTILGDIPPKCLCMWEGSLIMSCRLLYFMPCCITSVLCLSTALIGRVRCLIFRSCRSTALLSCV
jgi:hypothetical protein